MGRVAGAVNAAIGLTLGGFAAYYLSQANYDLISLASRKQPYEPAFPWLSRFCTPRSV